MAFIKAPGSQVLTDLALLRLISPAKVISGFARSDRTVNAVLQQLAYYGIASSSGY